ncbi:hypothetical protein KUCAC02_004564 [Chaenocephalus aceratus]|uniref:Uncharacterized protein n=1 Tax=Chaenocephalus aceratus TaxID=36190 RepID=A0ACB9X0N3_CHAAC|nr:hypothetical protein KUCAC02_004564 [Chaenocephalus aceratus]
MSMDPAILVLVMLAGVSHAFLPAAETKCKASQNTSQCSAILGGSVSIQVMNNASGHRLGCKRQLPTGPRIVFNLKKERVTIHESLKNRTEFFINNGTLKITHVEMNDSGVYNVEIFQHDGVLLRNVNFQLVVQESILHIVIIVCCTVGALLIVGVCCCACWKMRRGKKSGLETHCDGRQDGVHCFGPLGATVVLQLIDRAVQTERYILYKSSIKSTLILGVINNKIVTNAKQSRFSFNPSDGTFSVNNLSRNDSAEYHFEIRDGINIKENRALQLTIQAPVSSVLLASECLSQGAKRVSCSSGGGDSLQYSWTLDGRSLTDTELLSVNTETNSITLKQHVSGIVACSVRNNVSEVSKGEEISNCGFKFINCTSNGTQISQWVLAANNTLCVEPTTTSPTTIPETSTAADHSLLVCGVRAAVVVFALIGIAVYFAWKNKNYKKAEGSAYRPEREHQDESVVMVEIPSPIEAILVEAKMGSLETHCDGRQDGAQCFGPLGGTVVLKLIDRALETERYILYKSSNKSTIILNVINNKIVTNAIKSRSLFNLVDGTFSVNNLSRNDSDEYPFEISDGIKIQEKRALRLTIQAPVSSVLLASECLSQGEKRVSCSSGGGDSLQYSWTLDGRSLTDTELLSVNTETNSITLKQHVSGIVACSVRNNVSEVSKGEEISNCGFKFINCTSNGTQISQWVLAANNTLCVEPTTTSPTTIPETSTAADHSLLVCGVRAAVVVFALIGIAVYFAWKNKNYKKAEGSAYRPEREHQDESVVMVEM